MTDTSNTDLAGWRTKLAAMAAGSADTDGAHDSAHLDRVWRTAQALLEHHPEADRLVVLAACYLHDLVNLPKNDPERNQASTRSARLARHQLAHLGFPPDKLDAVAHAIEAHSFSAAIPAETIEAKIVQDADRMDGWAWWAWRACSTSPAAWKAAWPTRATRWERSATSTTAAIRWTTSWSSCRSSRT